MEFARRRLLAHPRRSKGASPIRLCPCSSDANLFSDGEGVIDFDAEIPDGALDLSYAPTAAARHVGCGFDVDERRFGASKEVGAEKVRLEADRCDPA
jgi:hypothetical protein